MNIFRGLGDFSHVLAILIILHKLLKTKSCAGISGKSQILYALVFTARYLDVWTSCISAYNTVMKLFFLAASYSTIYLIYIKFKTTYNRDYDTFRIEFLVPPALILSLLINYEFDIFEIMWAFSIYLESVAILPQLFLVSNLVSKTGEAENFILHYLSVMGCYRAFYLLNWIYRYYAEDHTDIIATVAGITQTVFYLDFFLFNFTKSVYSQCANLLGSDMEVVQTSCTEKQEKQEEAINVTCQLFLSPDLLAVPHPISSSVSDAEAGAHLPTPNSSEIQILTVA